MLGAVWGVSSSVAAEERRIIQERVQKRLAEKQRALDLAQEQSDWLDRSSTTTTTANKYINHNTNSGGDWLSRASTESATSYHFSGVSGVATGSSHSPGTADFRNNPSHHHHQRRRGENNAIVVGDVHYYPHQHYSSFFSSSDMMQQTPRTNTFNNSNASAAMNSISSSGSTGSSGQQQQQQQPPQSQQQSQQSQQQTSQQQYQQQQQINQDASADLLRDPYELRHGRRYLRDLVYPLPVDLPEIQRQNLRTLLGCSVFGRAVCAPRVAKCVPQKVLEVGCGSAYWSARCHEYFTTLGYRSVSFTGLDVAPLAPDLKKQGVNWTFVQHDFRRNPWPFDDGEFDLIMLKDLSLVVPLGSASQHFLDECIRLLKVGGTLELWESDHVLRSLLPHPPPPTSKQRAEHDMAVQTGTFLIGPGTPFAPAQNKYLAHANAWIGEALDRRKLPPTPCARIAHSLYQEAESLCDIGIRRVAIPLGELRWEGEKVPSSGGDGKGKHRERNLSPDQVALRQTALLSVVQMIESLEPLLKDVSGKNSEEWGHWWASMMADLMDPSRGAISGESLEIGAWWATKIADE